MLRRIGVKSCKETHPRIRVVRVLLRLITFGRFVTYFSASITFLFKRNTFRSASFLGYVLRVVFVLVFDPVFVRLLPCEHRKESSRSRLSPFCASYSSMIFMGSCVNELSCLGVGLRVVFIACTRGIR